MNTETIHYQCNGVECKGYLAYTESSWAKRPAVLVAHAWRGQDEFARQKARDLAELGYVGFAADLYGNGIAVESNEEAEQLMLPFFLDRKLLRERINAAFDVLADHPYVKSDSMGAIGFCFGGMAAIELLRSGAPLKGVVSFHGLLGYTLGNHHARPVPHGGKLEGSLLILHGYKDPMVSADDIQAIQAEFTKAGIDWQMVIFGNAVHAFTNPIAADPENGLLYEPVSAQRAWTAMCNFFDEIFAD